MGGEGEGRGAEGWKEGRGRDALLVMLLNQGMSFHDRLGSMNDCATPLYISIQSPEHPHTRRATHADRPRDALVLLDVLPLLHLGACVIVDGLHPHVLLTSPELRCIDGDEEALDAALLSVLHVLACDLAIAVNVQLKEERLAWRRGVEDVIERA